MPYRAPELFDVKTGTTLSEKVDIWVRPPSPDLLNTSLTAPAPPIKSLGCTLFAVAYNYSPFEDPAQGGGSIAMAVSSGRYKHPRHSPYSRAFQYVPLFLLA
jgi:serine/threonine kinase 16